MSATAQMPQYRCHKIVGALKIIAVESIAKPGDESDGSLRLIVEEPFSPITVDREYASKHNPQAGGYYVRYEDGYRSFSPGAAFENGYTKL